MKSSAALKREEREALTQIDKCVEEISMLTSVEDVKVVHVENLFVSVDKYMDILQEKGMGRVEIYEEVQKSSFKNLRKEVMQRLLRDWDSDRYPQHRRKWADLIKPRQIDLPPQNFRIAAPVGTYSQGYEEAMRQIAEDAKKVSEKGKQVRRYAQKLKQFFAKADKNKVYIIDDFPPSYEILQRLEEGAEYYVVFYVDDEIVVERRVKEGLAEGEPDPMSKLDDSELAPIFEGELDRQAMAAALSAAMKEQGLSVRKTAAAVDTSTNDIQRITKGTATLDKAAEVLSGLGYELHVEVRKPEQS
ncbi:hypothetical protein [uncultured Roseibium sp.]|uniref:hypothetical protein n=1 Tax=uncultured Roseibium sp. TaxID=1936171 RepID=UPI00262EBBDB|nr:hypothetical protein [uncultured Roseibium sp.]